MKTIAGREPVEFQAGDKVTTSFTRSNGEVCVLNGIVVGVAQVTVQWTDSSDGASWRENEPASELTLVERAAVDVEGQP
jgi:hypothetical protein